MIKSEWNCEITNKNRFPISILVKKNNVQFNSTQRISNDLYIHKNIISIIRSKTPPTSAYIINRLLLTTRKIS